MSSVALNRGLIHTILSNLFLLLRRLPSCAIYNACSIDSDGQAMATVTKRQWTNKSGEHESWMLAFTDANGKRHRKHFKTKREADADRITLEGQVVKGTFRAEAAKTTVADAIKMYVAHLEARHRRDAKVTTTYLATTKAELMNYVAPTPRDDDDRPKGKRAVGFTEGLGTIRLSQLTSSAVGDLRDRLLDVGVSVSTTRRALASLSRALAYAITKDLVAVNAAKGVKVIGRRDEGPQKIVPPSKDALRALLKAADPDFAVRLRFAAASGLRASEQWALRWRHVDLDVGDVTVESRVDIHGVEDTTKSKAGLRTVPLARAVCASLLEWKSRSAHSDDDDLVFPNTTGGHTRHGNMLKRQYGPLLDTIDGATFNWHSLRHFAVSTWIEQGLPPKTIQTYAGHASLAITMDRYGHLFPSSDHRSAMDRIADEVFS